MKKIDTSYKGEEEYIAFRNSDLVIIESMRDFRSINDDVVLIDGFVMILIKAGHASIKIDGCEFDLTPGCLFACTPRNIIENVMVSMDTEISGIFASTKSITRILEETNLDVTQFVLSRNHNYFELNSEQQKMFLKYLETLSSLLNLPDSPHKEKATMSLFQSFAWCITDFSNSLDEDVRDANYTSAENIFRKFLEMLAQSNGHFLNVNGYAERLNITPKYFSNICKSQSGQTASHIINERIVKEAKIQLRNPQLNIKQIASNLGFANASHFGTFMRRNTGKSPQALRDTL